MRPDQIAQERLAAQQITRPIAKTPSQVVAALGAMQAQDYTAALWAIGLRLPGSSEAEIEQAIADATIVRTWPLRGTLHFVAAEDARWMLELLTPHIIAGSARRRQQLGLDDATLARSRDVLIETLQGRKPHTRDQCIARLESAGIATAAQRGYHILWQHALAGLLCFGPRAGKQQTFVLLDEWTPNAKRLERDQALAELAARYFSGHGPATLQDFVWWSGLRVGDGRTAIELAGPALVAEGSGATRYWRAHASHTSTPPDKQSDNQTLVHLLPAFDEYLIAYRGRDAVLDPEYATRIVPGGNGVFRPILVHNGRIVGTWKRTLKKRQVAITLDPFAPLRADATQAVAAAAADYGRFLGLEANLAG